MKHLFIDVETTGTDPRRHAVHQISGSIIIGDGAVKTRKDFDFRCRPHKGAEIDEVALQMSGLTRDELMALPEPRVVLEELKTIFSAYVNRFDKADKFFFYTYNGKFDHDFMYSFFENNGDRYYGSWVWSGIIDIMSLAADYLKPVRHEMPNFKLSTVAAKLGIPIEDDRLHDSQYDIEISRKVYEIVTVTNEGRE